MSHVFSVTLELINYDMTVKNYENSSESFSNTIDYYTKAIEQSKGEILWGSDVIEATIEFYVDGTRTECTRIEYINGGFVVTTKQ